MEHAIIIGDNEVLSREVQEKLFSMGYKWNSGDKYVLYTEKQVLYADENRFTLTHSGIQHANDQEFMPIFGRHFLEGIVKIKEKPSVVRWYHGNSPTKLWCIQDGKAKWVGKGCADERSSFDEKRLLYLDNGYKRISTSEAEEIMKGWTVKELTVAEISEKLGYEVKVVKG